MTWEWHIGDPVDDATGGSMDAQIGVAGQMTMMLTTIIMKMT